MSELRVPGAELYYERRGTGPVLLFIPGGNGDAGPYAQVADALSGDYTIIGYDRRGFSRSRLEGQVADERRLAADVEDAVRLIEASTDEPAYVFGSSSGAIVALDLLTRYPDRVRLLVAHEPPAVTLLPDAERHLDFFDDVYDTYQANGPLAAMAKFLSGMGGSPPPPGGAEIVERNVRFFLEHELRTYPRGRPDLDALQARADRIVLAGGRDSRDAFPYRATQMIAKHLGTEILDLPGGHVGYLSYPAEFAERLRAALSN